MENERKKFATTIRARAQSVTCPHCGEENDGWINDPRGSDDTCQVCNKPYSIATDSEIILL